MEKNKIYPISPSEIETTSCIVLFIHCVLHFYLTLSLDQKVRYVYLLLSHHSIDLNPSLHDLTRKPQKITTRVIALRFFF